LAFFVGIGILWITLTVAAYRVSVSGCSTFIGRIYGDDQGEDQWWYLLPRWIGCVCLLIFSVLASWKLERITESKEFLSWWEIFIPIFICDFLPFMMIPPWSVNREGACGQQDTPVHYRNICRLFAGGCCGCLVWSIGPLVTFHVMYALKLDGYFQNLNYYIIFAPLLVHLGFVLLQIVPATFVF